MATKRKMAELQKLTMAELQKRLRELKSEHYELRFQKVSGKLENFRRIREIKHDIARVNTLITQIEKGS
jgi:large subunit ribosomal protein L29